ncbi:sulfatase-like hydrolase/transferase [Planctomycetota bacterium]
MKVNRRDFLKAISFGSAALALQGCAKSYSFLSAITSKTKTNFVIVLCDDLGYGDLSCYGHPHIKTPNLDNLAAEGLKLTDCYAAAPVCSPARAGILTGRTPYRCGIYDWIPHQSPMHLKTKEVTFAKLLKNAGYATCQIGKWHCNGDLNSPEYPQPNDHGFEYWLSTQDDAWPSHHNPDNFVRNGQPLGRLEGYSSQLIAQEAIDFLQKKWDRSKSFCLFVCFHAPHEPIVTAPEFLDMYKDKKEAEYYGNVTQMDYEFGRLMTQLDKMKLRDQTFVMFTSDNGPEILNRYPGAERSFGSPGPLRGMKLHMYEGGIRVPGIIRWPNHIKPGSVSQQPVNGTDVLPTLCSIAGLKLPVDRPIDGLDITPIFKDKKLKRKVPLYWRYDLALSEPFKVAMRQGDFKILADNKMTKFELYNLSTDISEKNDLAESESERLQAMRKTLIELHNEIDTQRPKW